MPIYIGHFWSGHYYEFCRISARTGKCQRARLMAEAHEKASSSVVVEKEKIDCQASGGGGGEWERQTMGKLEPIKTVPRDAARSGLSGPVDQSA